MRCALTSACAASRAASTTHAPASPSESAAAAPMPRLAPVMIATFPTRLCIGAASAVTFVLAALRQRRPIGQAGLPGSILRLKQSAEGGLDADQRDLERDCDEHRRQQAALDARRQRWAGAGPAPRLRPPGSPAVLRCAGTE